MNKLLPPGNCIIWDKCKTKQGYGKLAVKSKYYYAHRYYYELKFGPIPKGMIIMHLCDNPSCINISHLKMSTSKENTQDMINKERHPFIFNDKCQRGHSKEDMYTWEKNGHRRCRACNTLKAREYRQRKKDK